MPRLDRAVVSKRTRIQVVDTARLGTWTFLIDTSTVTSTRNVVITATLNGSSRTAPLTVTSG